MPNPCARSVPAGSAWPRQAGRHRLGVVTADQQLVESSVDQPDSHPSGRVAVDDPKDFSEVEWARVPAIKVLWAFLLQLLGHIPGVIYGIYQVIQD